ncbi:DUF2236 domain-containing protein [Oxalobacteraceae bacterium OM1]|nr:DUF2236 domain-containing protein [Oxalobacteraceae bacterium OM1]
MQRRLEAAAETFIEAGNGYAVDFAKPAGEAALTPPDSVSWRVFKNPLTLFVGGVAAVILELAEPRVCAGVWNHTSFQQDPMRRIQRTGFAAMVTVYGARSDAEAMIAQVRRMHARVQGVTSAGQAYRADDPELLTWVHATASFGFLEAYAAYAQPLTLEERDRFIEEGELSARLYGTPDVPRSQRAMDALLATTEPLLEPSVALNEFLSIMRRTPVLPAPLHYLQGMLVRAAVELLPAALRDRLQLGGRWDLSPWQRNTVRRLGFLSDRVVLQSAPAAQACLRLGLPVDFLYAR